MSKTEKICKCIATLPEYHVHDGYHTIQDTLNVRHVKIITFVVLHCRNKDTLSVYDI